MSDVYGETEMERLFRLQREFGANFYDIHAMSEEERHQLTVKLAAALHGEVSSLLAGLDFRTHRSSEAPACKGNIMYEGVDVFRYLQAIMNLWGIDAKSFSQACDDRNVFLRMRHEMESAPWNGAPAVILDLDDVVTTFKEEFYRWMEVTYDITIDRNTKEYYPSKELSAIGKNSEDALNEFISCGMLKRLGSHPGVVERINELYKSGRVWIHLVTARPGDNLVCRYDTYRWLQKSGMKVHRISFESNKYLWLLKTAYWQQQKVVCAIDDSGKNVREFASHHVPCLVPRRTYNEDLETLPNVRMYDTVGGLVVGVDAYHRRLANS